MPKKPKYIYDRVHEKGCYVRAWKEGRGRDRGVAVQVWWSGKPEGEPDGDWVMPPSLGMFAVDQAILQTDKP